MHHLAIQWLARQPGVSGILIGATNPQQVGQNLAAFEDEIPASVIDEVSKISDEAMRHIPHVENIFSYYP